MEITSKMTTIKKIAELAGVSPSTVSRVLNNPDYHCSSPEKRDRIWKAAMELNYVPNEAAKNLKMGNQENKEKTYYISVLMTRMESAQMDPFFAELLRVIETEIHRHYCILSKVWYMPIFSNDRKCRTANLKKLVEEMNESMGTKTDGLIVIGKCNKDALVQLNKTFKNVVTVNRNPSNYDVDEVTCDGRQVAIQAVEHLISLGHRDIGYVGECHHEARYKGYIETLERYDIEPDNAYVFETKQTEAEGYEIMNRILQSEDIPTGIYCANDITAVGMLKCLSKSKNRYASISIISSDNIEEAQFTTPMLTTISLPKEEMGKFAMYLLLDRIKGGHKGVVKMKLEGTLIKRGSCVNLKEMDLIDYYI
jgi:DNA-binding LacI/PurR family transcriptional regulator